LPDDDLAAVQRLLAFLYLRGYDDKKDQNLQNAKVIPSDGDEPDVVVGNNLDVFMVADKFEIVPLKNLARSRLIDWINQNATRSPLLVRDIWCTIPPHETELRDAITKAILCQARKFLRNDEGVVLLTDIPELCVKALKQVVDENSRLSYRLSNLRIREIIRGRG